MHMYMYMYMYMYMWMYVHVHVHVAHALAARNGAVRYIYIIMTSRTFAHLGHIHDA